jgi:hypothetical protein
MKIHYHNSILPENTKKTFRSIRRWRPGEPIPPGTAPDPLAALARHAAADEQQQLEEAERDARQRRRAA